MQKFELHRIALAALVVVLGGLVALAIAGVNLGAILGGLQGTAALLGLLAALTVLAFGVWCVGKTNWRGREAQLALVAVAAVAVVLASMAIGLGCIQDAIKAIKPQLVGLMFTAVAVIALVMLALTGRLPTKRP